MSSISSAQEPRPSRSQYIPNPCNPTTSYHSLSSAKKVPMDIFWALDFAGAGGGTRQPCPTITKALLLERTEVSEQDAASGIQKAYTNPCLRLVEVKKRAGGLVRASHTDCFEGKRREKISETPGRRSRSLSGVVRMLRESFRSSARIKLHRGKVG